MGRTCSTHLEKRLKDNGGRSRWEDNNKTDLREIGSGDAD
jgi:hypothetical protein